jgi:nucleoid-associated protein YgaU
MISIYSRYYGLDAAEVDDKVALPARPTPPREDYPDSILHVIIGGETLDQLARSYYGREDLWWRIADANPRRFAFEWRPGETLVIPPPRAATRTGVR